jgi:hypothetical protein
VNARALRLAQSVGGAALPLGTTAMRAIDFHGDTVEDRERALTWHAARLREAIVVLSDRGVDVHDLDAVRAAVPTLPKHLRRAVRIELGSAARHRLARRRLRHPRAFERRLEQLAMDVLEVERAFDALDAVAELDDDFARVEGGILPVALALLPRLTRDALDRARADARADVEAGRTPPRARLEEAARLHADAIDNALDRALRGPDA